MAKKIAKKPAHKKESKVGVVIKEFKSGKLHSGSKQGPVVRNPKQAIAIGISESRKAGEPVKPAKRAMKKRHKSKESWESVK